MAFLAGAECSTAGNPLSQFTKHVQDDKSLQRDRLAGPGPNASLAGFRSAGRGVSQDDVNSTPAFGHTALLLGPCPRAFSWLASG